ncbi:D-ribose ABC transporter substrate-binding protein [Lacrimispora sphenoides]|uniref:Ribose transport system substrate-binding protein n=1 Tax=Lacrimispora sphenoides JCM 1415 TaxID=1297793 RepID=A0ABY1CIJ0_9FIRM|nr:D-ribose ABC transporter substrate-binding protein [Lacrimispora sphenoides]SEU06721.1 ribose transport system substrate-binding protein [[Clostridium] sphenoides JCM 1415]SUY49157.1 ribose ABC transporter periplasmic D-ribose-binding protein [Lacrimispora sphenoides]
MKKFKKVAALVTVMALGASALVGCSVGGGEKKEGGSSAGSAQTVGFSVSTLNNPFFVTLSDGAKNAAKEKGIQLTVVDAGDDSAKQISDIEDLISKNIKVLIVNPVDSDAVASAVESATKKGIKVIAVDRAVNGAEVECQIASDNVAGARMAAEYLKELVGDGAKVAELEGVPGASAAIDRGQGFHEVADKDLKVVSSQTANFNRAEGLSVMENILQADGDIKGVFAHNDEMALGAVEAIASTGKDIKVVGFDATDDARKAVEDGTMAATVAQQPDLMGKTAVETAISIMEGKSVEKSIPVEVTLIKK